MWGLIWRVKLKRASLVVDRGRSRSSYIHGGGRRSPGLQQPGILALTQPLQVLELFSCLIPTWSSSQAMVANRSVLPRLRHVSTLVPPQGLPPAEKGSEPVSSRREEFYMRAGAAQGTISRRGRPTSHRSGGLGRLSVSTAVGSSGRRRVGVRHLRKAHKTIQKVRWEDAKI